MEFDELVDKLKELLDNDAITIENEKQKKLDLERKFSPCPDEYRGIVKIDNKIVETKFFEINNDYNKTEKNNIILILESPHIKEFNENYNPIRPANGKTGENIKSCLKEVLTVLFNNINVQEKIFNLYIMNAIQYQTSLGINTEYFRNALFVSFWNTEGKADFKERLNNVFTNKDIIINACTIGSNYKSKIYKKVLKNIDKREVENDCSNLNIMVKKAIKEELSNCNYLYIEASHPIRWTKYIDEICFFKR